MFENIHGFVGTRSRTHALRHCVRKFSFDFPFPNFPHHLQLSSLVPVVVVVAPEFSKFVSLFDDFPCRRLVFVSRAFRRVRSTIFARNRDCWDWINHLVREFMSERRPARDADDRRTPARLGRLVGITHGKAEHERERESCSPHPKVTRF